MKKILVLIFLSALIGQDLYDPLTGERIPNQKFDPNTGTILEEKFDPLTGELLDQKKIGLNAKIILISGDTVQGKLISQDIEKITIDSQITGEVSFYRSNIKEMIIEGIPISSRRATAIPKVKKGNSRTDLTMNDNGLVSNAKNEAHNSNYPVFNAVVGTGACLNPAVLITLPVMGLAIYTNVNVKEPKSEFYKNLNKDQKKEFSKVYKKELRKLRTEQCFAPTQVVATFFGLFMLLSFSL